MMVKSKKTCDKDIGKSATSTQGTTRSQHLDEQLFSRMASGGASNGMTLTLCYSGFFTNPTGTTSPRRAMVMAKKVHQAEIGVKGTIDVTPKKHV